MNSQSPFRQAGFTLFEVILALMILGLISGAVYSISSASLEATKAVLSGQAGVRRLEAFLHVTRDAFLNLPADGKVFLRMSKTTSGAPVPEIVFQEAAGVFGVSTLGTGSLVLAARPMADGSRTFSMLVVPGTLSDAERDRYMSKGPWISLLPKVERVAWTFYSAGEWKEEWQEEWQEGSPRPESVRLQFEYLEIPGSLIDIQFWIPQLVQSAPNTPPPPQPDASPTPPAPAPAPAK